MNARTDTAVLSKPSLQLLAIGAIVPSKTHVQEMRRARFDKKALDELARNIAEVGILQPPLARPLDGGKFEIIAGERRWLGAKLAGLKELHVNVRELTDDQALEAQLSENLQREDLHELEEAEGYEELMNLKKINADAVADMVGKSRSYVYARTKLLALCPEARKAFYTGVLDASKALLIARIGHPDTQRQALKDLTEVHKWNKEELAIPTYRDARDHIEEHYMLRLTDAVFPVADADLVKKAGACTTCPKRTGNQRDLFADIKSADVCTDPKCFAEKKAAHRATRKEELVAKGHEVVTGTAARKINPGHYHSPREGYVKFDEACIEDPKRRTYRQLLAGSDVKPVMVETEKGAFTPMVRPADCKAALEKKGITPRKEQASTSSAGPSRQDQIRREVENGKGQEIASRQALAVYKAAPAKFSKADFLHLLTQQVESYDFEQAEELTAVLGIKFDENASFPERLVKKKLTAMAEADLVRLLHTIRILALYGSERAKAALKIKVDLRGIEKKVEKEYADKVADALKADKEAEKKKAATAKAKAAPDAKKLGDAWPFPTGAKAPIGTPKKKKSPKSKSTKRK